MDNILEEKSPFGGTGKCKNSWICEEVYHYCPICDMLEMCRDQDEPLCEDNIVGFDTYFGVHKRCLPKLFKRIDPYLSKVLNFTEEYRYRLMKDFGVDTIVGPDGSGLFGSAWKK